MEREDITIREAFHQVDAMRADLFEIGIFDSASSTMLNRVWDRENLRHSMGWLKHENADGKNIYVRPRAEHQLSMVDDLRRDTVQQMFDTGYAPSVVIETSPDNYQAWLNHGKILDREHSTAAARALAERFGGDTKAADWRHYGRLGGFTNRKPKHQLEDGKFPFVAVRHAEDKVYDQAESLLWHVDKKIAHEHAVQARNAELWKLREAAQDRTRQVKGIQSFRDDARYGGDMHRADAAYAVYALARGVSREAVAQAIMSRDLSKKGRPGQQLAYVERTIGRAMVGRER